MSETTIGSGSTTAAPQSVVDTGSSTATAEAPSQEAADVAAWKEITGSEPSDEGPELKPLPPVDEKGEMDEPVAESKPDSQPKADAKPEPKPEPEKPAAKELDKETRYKVVKAKEVVARILKYDRERMDKMDPQDLLDLSQRLEPVIEQTERYKQDMHKWKERARGQKAPDADTPDTDRRRSAEPVDEAEDGDAERSTGGIDQLLAEYLDADSLKAVKRQMRAERSKYENEAVEAKSRADEAERSLIRTNVTTARSRMVEQFPGLKDDDAFTRMMVKMDKIDPQGNLARDIDQFTDFLRDLCWAEFGPVMEQATRQKLITQNRRDIKGQPDVASQATQPSTWSQDDYDAYAFRAAEQAQGNQAKFDELMAKVPKPKR